MTQALPPDVPGRTYPLPLDAPGGPAPRRPVGLYVIAGVLAVALVAACLWAFVLRDRGTPPAPAATTTTDAPARPTATAPTTTAAAPPAGVPASTSVAPAASATTSAVSPGPGPVSLNDTFTDAGVGVTITVEKATTTWLTALPQRGDPTEDSAARRMVGLRVRADTSKAKYAGMGPSGSDFTLLAPDGSQTTCADLLAADEYAGYTKAILAALGADKAFAMDYATNKGEGWFWCTTADYNDAAFDAPGFTVHYLRPAGKDDAGALVPQFTHDTRVTAP